jgi:aerobic-type carbon monoxide dehydrogenase small subunit (CoxS/CutS family)
MVNFELNGVDVSVEASATMTLLDLLRVELGVKSVKKGCEQGECGVCTILVDGYPMTSCLILAPQVEGRHVCTIEGFVENPLMKELCEAFMENGAVQCGFCTPGMLLSAYALLRDNKRPSEEEVKTAIEGNICRCTGYVAIIEAILDAAERIAPD